MTIVKTGQNPIVSSPTSQSRGTYVGTIDANAGIPTIGTGPGNIILKGDYWLVTIAGTMASYGALGIGDVLFSKKTGAALAADFFHVPFSSGGGLGIDKTYSIISNMLTNQGEQTAGAWYLVNDATGDPTVESGWAIYEKQIASTGNISDYIKRIEQDSFNPPGSILAKVRNQSGATITKGKVVYISGATGQLPTISLAKADAEATSAGTLGFVYADIANNGTGQVILLGTIDGLDTSAFIDGAIIYLSPTTAGEVTSTKPTAPNHTVTLGEIAHAHNTQGKIFARIDNGYELEELHDLLITGKAANHVLQLEETSPGVFIWKNKFYKFTQLSDSFSSYTGRSENVVGVKTDETGLEPLPTFNINDYVPYASSYGVTITALTTVTVPIGMAMPHKYYAITVTPTSSAAAIMFYVTNKTTTTFDITFVSSVTGYVSFDFLIVR